MNDREKIIEPKDKIIVGFSGGKDSTVVSRIVRDALQNESVIHFFGDTTLEFPSTHVYVDGDFRVENPFTPMIPSETENDFFKLCNVFGPPSKFERWCCTIFKTSNLNSEYQNLDGNSLTFLGIRRNESKERQKYERTQKHSKIGSQINAMPIIDWYDCDVWLYILYKGIKFNEAYRWGYKRVGCWCCPNNSDWSMMLTDIYYPQLSNKWKSVLYDFATKTNKTDIEDYVENGELDEIGEHEEDDRRGENDQDRLIHIVSEALIEEDRDKGSHRNGKGCTREDACRLGCDEAEVLRNIGGQPEDDRGANDAREYRNEREFDDLTLEKDLQIARALLFRLVLTVFYDSDALKVDKKYKAEYCHYGKDKTAESENITPNQICSSNPRKRRSEK